MYIYLNIVQTGIAFILAIKTLSRQALTTGNTVAIYIIYKLSVAKIKEEVGME